MNERPYQLEVIRVPMADGSMGWTVQAVCRRGGAFQFVRDTWHHAHTWPGTPEGHDKALAWAVDVQMRCGQSWAPSAPTWFLVSCVEQDGRLGDTTAWSAWRKRTGRK